MSRFFSTKSITKIRFPQNCCKNYNKMNTKLEQGKIRVNVVKNTHIKLNKSIDFLINLCYYENSRDD